MNRFLIEISRINSLIHSLSSFGLSILYTVGHVFIAWACATLIFNASFLVASADAILEPIINGFWFYLLHKYAHKRLKASTLAVIYTIGHFTIATSWSFFLLGFALDKAIVDAIVEPLLNGFWFYSLVYIWNTQPKQVTN